MPKVAVAKGKVVKQPLKPVVSVVKSAPVVQLPEKPRVMPRIFEMVVHLEQVVRHLKYVGIGTPEQMSQKNRLQAQAEALLAEYQKQWGGMFN